VTSADERADSSARNDAIELVDNALKSGRIVQADRDMRVDQLRHAQTLQDIELAVRDLRAAGPTPPPVVTPIPAMGTGQTAGTPGQPWPLVSYGPGSTAGSADAAEIARVVGKGGKVIGGVIAFVVLISVVVPIAGVIIAFFAARDSFPDFGDLGPTDETTYLPGQTPGGNGVNVHTVDGYQDMVDALKDETGQSYTFTTVIYPRYAVLEVPTGVNDRYQNFYWDGDTLALNDSRGTTSECQVDLDLVEPQQMVDMLTTVRARLDSPDSWYVVIGCLSDAPQISAYASNDFGESTYVVEALDGTVVYDSEGEATPEAPVSPAASP
jgi:hypothetical protein